MRTPRSPRFLVAALLLTAITPPAGAAPHRAAADAAVPVVQRAPEGAETALPEGVRFDTPEGLSALRRFSLQVLHGGLGDTDPYERNYAASSLAAHGDWSGMAILEDAVESPDPGVRRAAIEGLGEVGNGRALEMLDVIYHRSDGFDQILVLEGLRGTHSAEALGLLIEATGHRDSSVRLQAVEDLGLLGDRRAVPQLRSALGRAAAPTFEKTLVAQALLRLGDHSGLSILLGALHDESSAARAAATLALGYGEDDELRPVLRGLLADRDPDVRIAAAAALTRYRITEGLPQLKQALQRSEDAITRRRAGTLLEHVDFVVGREVVLAGLSADDVEVRLLAARAVGLAGDSQSVGTLTAMVGVNEDPIVRANLAWALGRVGNPNVILPLLELVREREPAVRYTAADGLARTASRLLVLAAESREKKEFAPPNDRERPKPPRRNEP